MEFLSDFRAKTNPFLLHSPRFSTFHVSLFFTAQKKGKLYEHAAIIIRRHKNRRARARGNNNSKSKALGNQNDDGEVEEWRPKSGPLKLNLTELGQVNSGELFSNIDDVWDGVLVDPNGAFESIATLRRGGGGERAPVCLLELADVCCQSWDAFESEKERKSFLYGKMMELRGDVWTTFTN